MTYEEAMQSSAPKWVKDVLALIEEERQRLQTQLQMLRGDAPPSRVFIDDYPRPRWYLYRDDVTFDLAPDGDALNFDVRARVCRDNKGTPILNLNSDADGIVVVPGCSNSIDIRRRGDY
jgi:hypothetical protein